MQFERNRFSKHSQTDLCRKFLRSILCFYFVFLQGHAEPLFSVDWSPCGNYLATACKDGRVRIFEPRGSPDAIRVGGDIAPKKGARVMWVLNGDYLVVTGFSRYVFNGISYRELCLTLLCFLRQSERQLTLLRSNDLKEVASKKFEVSPTIMIPHYDPDSSTLFVTGKVGVTAFTQNFSMFRRRDRYSSTIKSLTCTLRCS